MEDVEQTAEPERLFVDADLRGFIEVDMDTHAAQCGKALRSPGGAGLTVAARRDAEDALDVLDAGPLATFEFRRAFEPAHFIQIERRSRLDTVEVGVVADVVAEQGSNHVLTPPFLQHARLFAHQLKGSPHAALFQILRDAEGGVVGLGEQVIFGVEPEHHVDRRFRPGCQGCQAGNQKQDQTTHSDLFYCCEALW